MGTQVRVCPHGVNATVQRWGLCQDAVCTAHRTVDAVYLEGFNTWQRKSKKALGVLRKNWELRCEFRHS